MIKTIAVALLKRLLAYLGSDLDAETRAAFDAYEAKRKETEEKQKAESEAIALIEAEIGEMHTRRENLHNERKRIESEIERTKSEIEELNDEKNRKLDRLRNLSDGDILRVEL